VDTESSRLGRSAALGQGTSADYEPGATVASGAALQIPEPVLGVIPAAVYVCRADGVLVQYNKRAAELWGREPVVGDLSERFCGSHRLFRMDGGELPHSQCPMAECLRHGQPVRDQEVVIERVDGTRIVALANISALKSDSGAVVGAINCFQDITGRRVAKARLDESERHLRSLVGALPSAIYTTDADGRITYYNDAAANMWGYRPELGRDEFCGSWKIYRPDGTPLPHDECPMAIALREKRPIRGMEAVAERPDGVRIPFIPYPTPLFNADGELTGAVNMLVDISERKLAERTVAAHLDAQTALFEFTNRLLHAGTGRDVHEAALDAVIHALDCDRAAVLLYDGSGRMVFAAWRGLSEGYRRAVEGHSPWTRDAIEPQPIYIEDVERADLGDDLKAVVRNEGIRALGFVPLVARGRLIGKFMAYCDGPRVFGARESGLALTIARLLGFSLERLREEEARQRALQSSQLLNAIVRTSDDAIISMDLNGTITSWNRGAERLYGYALDEAAGKPIAILIPPARRDEEVGLLNRIRNGEHIEHYETIRARKDGSLVSISLSVSPVMDEAGRVVGASKIARDITAQKQAQVHQELLAQEIQHRTKNLFAVVQAVVARSFEDNRSVADIKSAILSRLQSLAQTHAMLLDHDWSGADLTELVRMETTAYVGRVTIEGPSLTLDAKTAQNFALAVHELATNAVKYGALSNLSGRVHISWSVADGGKFTFRWRESGGPPVMQPQRRGFGSTVLDHVMGHYFGAPPLLAYEPAGLTYELNGTLPSV
jgi:PAS domain S-box-containing protein